MGSRTWKVALLAAVVAAGVLTACAPLPKPLPALMVNTTADTFDGVCDELDCSLLDAIHTANGRVNTNNLPNEIRVPEGTYVLTEDAPVQITRALVINGANRLTTTLDLTGSPVTAPNGVFDVQFPLVLTGMRIESNTETPTHVVASCSEVLPKSFSLMNSRTAGLAATSAACDAVLVGTEVLGPVTVLSANTLSGTGSRLPFPDEPIELRRFSFVSSTITGPIAADGTSGESVLTIHPLEGLNMNGTFTGTHFDRVGLSLGRADDSPDTGNVTATASSSSFDLAAESGARTIEVIEGSSLRIIQSTVYGGGAEGAIHADGTLILQGATIANAGPGIVVGDAASVTARRSILSAFSGPVCTAPITLLVRNVVVGTSCGTVAAPNVSVASHDDLQLGPVDGTGSRTPTFSMTPAETSPVVDIIPIEGTAALDCPFNVGQNIGTSLDQRGFFRPSGSACDAGAVEYQYPAPTDPAPEDPPAEDPPAEDPPAE